MGIINKMYLIEIKFEPGKIRLNLGMGKLITMFTYHKMWWGLEGSWYIRHALILNISPFFYGSYLIVYRFFCRK